MLFRSTEHSAKNRSHRKEITQIQTDFNEQVAKFYGLERDSGGTIKRKKKSIQQFRAEIQSEMSDRDAAIAYLMDYPETKFKVTADPEKLKAYIRSRVEERQIMTEEHERERF